MHPGLRSCVPGRSFRCDGDRAAVCSAEVAVAPYVRPAARPVDRSSAANRWTRSSTRIGTRPLCRPTSSGPTHRTIASGIRRCMRACAGSVAAPTAGPALHRGRCSDAIDRAGRRARRDHAARRATAPSSRSASSAWRSTRSIPRSTRSPEAAARRSIERARAERRRIVGVGTTTTRALEAAALEGRRRASRPGAARRSLFIYPGFAFRVVERAADQLPRAAVVAADAGVRLCRPRARAGGVPRGRRRAVPVLQLRGRDVHCVS